MGSFTKRVVLLGITLGLLQGSVHAAGFVDVLDLPATPSALAIHSPLLDAARAGDRLVVVGQRGHILYSDDAGQHWQQAAVPVSVDLNALYFASPQQGWAVGGDGVVLHSSDAGATWRKQLDGRQIGPLLSQHYAALAAGEPGNQQWAHWAGEGERLSEEGADKPLLDVWFSDEQVGYVVGVFNLILRTDDGGQHWTPFQDRTDNPEGYHLNAIASTGDGLYIAGEQGLLLKWDATQARFLAVQTPYQGSYFGVIGRPGEVLAYGLRGHVLRSTDGGVSWAPLTSGVQTSITAATFGADGRFQLFTQAGQLLVEQPAEAQLQRPDQAEPSPVAGATLAADGSLVVVGSRGARVLSQPANLQRARSDGHY